MGGKGRSQQQMPVDNTNNALASLLKPNDPAPPPPEEPPPAPPPPPPPPPPPAPPDNTDNVSPISAGEEIASTMEVTKDPTRQTGNVLAQSVLAPDTLKTGQI